MTNWQSGREYRGKKESLQPSSTSWSVRVAVINVPRSHACFGFAQQLDQNWGAAMLAARIPGESDQKEVARATGSQTNPALTAGAAVPYRDQFR